MELFDHLQSQIVRYAAQIGHLLAARVPEERRGQPAPAHPKAGPGNKKAADDPRRTLLWRLSGVDLTTIDGIGIELAQVLLTEVGPDLKAFPTEKDFICWLHLGPRTAISGGVPLTKKRNGLGANRIGGMLHVGPLGRSQRDGLGRAVPAHRPTQNRKNRRLRHRAKLAQLIYRLLRYGQPYVDIGEKAEEDRLLARRVQNLFHQATEFGYRLVPSALGG